jgi:hypothetical protein
MLKQTQLLKTKLEESRRSGYQNNISRLRPGQESIMADRPWELERFAVSSKPAHPLKDKR